jgi:hypothetical protein|tara:strand:+ start:1159 stop:1365 length:207 start_codon:yes stop_codon:yes gene_type:complete
MIAEKSNLFASDFLLPFLCLKKFEYLFFPIENLEKNQIVQKRSLVQEKSFYVQVFIAHLTCYIVDVYA